MNYNNQLIQTGRISEIGEPLTSNIKSSYRMGIELSLDIQLLPWLKWSINNTFSSNKIKDFTEYVSHYDESFNELSPIIVHYPKTDIAFSPSIVGNNTFNIKYHNSYALIHTQWVSKQYLDNTACNERAIDAYCVTNLNVGYNFHPSLLNEINISLRINNLFATEYETSGWVASYVVDKTSTIDNRSIDDGLAVQAKTNFMLGLKIKL